MEEKMAWMGVEPKALAYSILVSSAVDGKLVQIPPSPFFLSILCRPYDDMVQAKDKDDVNLNVAEPVQRMERHFSSVYVLLGVGRVTTSKSRVLLDSSRMRKKKQK
jgi:hypothetical protein